MGHCISWKLRLVFKLLRHQMGSCLSHVFCCSGGIDSVSLYFSSIMLLHSNLERLRAIHVRHFCPGITQNFIGSCSSIFFGSKANIFLAVAILPFKETSFELEGRVLRQKVWGALNSPRAFWLAHHTGDQLESFRIQSLRLSGLSGPFSIPLVGLLSSAKMKLRPYLEESRPSLRSFGVWGQLAWLFDHTNASKIVLRGALRTATSNSEDGGLLSETAGLVGLSEGHTIGIVTKHGQFLIENNSFWFERLTFPNKLIFQHALAFWLKVKAGSGISFRKMVEVTKQHASLRKANDKLLGLQINLDKVLTEVTLRQRK
ncbi:tRNA(Ile)-lysidine synthetase [Candidatus Tremblaya phenacola PAVE]|nr:tRNA(Ile)-lysidine synthetase [Candidatus Tremblaya phenacola PAVE]